MVGPQSCITFCLVLFFPIYPAEDPIPGKSQGFPKDFCRLLTDVDYGP